MSFQKVSLKSRYTIIKRKHFKTITIPTVQWDCFSEEGPKIPSWPWLSLLRGCGSLTMTSLVNLYTFFLILPCYCKKALGLRVDMEGWWFENSISQLLVCFSEEGAKNISWQWLSPLRVLGILTMTFTAKLLYMPHYFILVLLNALGLRVDMEGWWYDLPMSQLRISLSAQGAKNICWHWLEKLYIWITILSCYSSIHQG